MEVSCFCAHLMIVEGMCLVMDEAHRRFHEARQLNLHVRSFLSDGRFNQRQTRYVNDWYELLQIRNRCFYMTIISIHYVLTRCNLCRGVEFDWPFKALVMCALRRPARTSLSWSPTLTTRESETQCFDMR